MQADTHVSRSWGKKLERKVGKKVGEKVGLLCSISRNRLISRSNFCFNFFKVGRRVGVKVGPRILILKPPNGWFCLVHTVILVLKADFEVQLALEILRDFRGLSTTQDILNSTWS